MFHSKTVEIGVGLFVAAGFAALFMLAMKVSNLASYSTESGYEITAAFDNVGGLKVRSQVSMSGVVVGRVKSIEFDDELYQAIVTMNIDGRFERIPEDTFANIYTAGLLGEQYIGLDPGGSDKYLVEGDEIKQTQSALILEQVIGQFLFDKAAGEDGEAAPASGDAAQPAAAFPGAQDPFSF